MKLITSPQKIGKEKKPMIFLAGSIEMGQAEDWQTEIAGRLGDYAGTLLNPRREHWGYNWHQSIKNKKFREQLEWEFAGLEKSDYIIMYFAPGSKSPISLLELGTFARSHKIICCCPQKFWRRANVEFICQKFKIPFVDDLDKLIGKLKKLNIVK
jgi:hypothetical protein